MCSKSHAGQDVEDPRSAPEFEDFINLIQALRDGSIWSFDKTSYLKLIKSAYGVELEYLKTAYAISYGKPQPVAEFPSQVLYKTQYPEIDRTTTGLLALRWIEEGDHEAFTEGQQPAQHVLSKDSFRLLRHFFFTLTNGYDDLDTLFTLITLQTTNDLGKSSALEALYNQFYDDGFPTSAGHDLFLHQFVSTMAHRLPCLSVLSMTGLSTFRKLVQLGAYFSPAQLAQAEAPPSMLYVLNQLDLSPSELNLKFAEVYLDLAGVQGHRDPRGAIAITEPVYQAYEMVRQVSLDVLNQHKTPYQAYTSILEQRLDILKNAGWDKAREFDLSESEDFVKARLLCMGRVSDPDTAEIFTTAFDNLDAVVRQSLAESMHTQGDKNMPAVQPTYMPGMIGQTMNKFSETSKKEKINALTAIFEYLGRVMHLSEYDSVKCKQEVHVVERDTKETLQEVIASDRFLTDPFGALAGLRLPDSRVARKKYLE